MDRKQFINELRSKLMGLPYEEREKAISYYEEYFDDAGAENEDSVIYELGDIERIAQEIIENSTSTANSLSVNKFTVGNDDNFNGDGIDNDKVTVKVNKEKQKLKPIYIVLIIIGAIASFPLVMTLFGLLMGLIGVIIGVIATAFGLVISGIAAIFTIPFAGIAVVGGILYHLGKGILSLALLAVIILVVVKLIKVIIEFIKNREN